MEHRKTPTRTEKRLRKPGRPAATDDAGALFVVFSIGREKYAADIAHIREILKPQEITEIPFTPDFLSGVINLRGKIVPVTDLRVRFGIAAAGAPAAERILVAQHGGGSIGLIVDSVDSVRPIPKRIVQPAPPIISGPIDSDYTAGIAALDIGVVVILDLEKTLDRNAVRRREPAQAG